MATTLRKGAGGGVQVWNGLLNKKCCGIWYWSTADSCYSGSRYLNTNRCVIYRSNPRPKNTYRLTYPTTLVNPDGSSYTINYSEPRKIIKLPVNLETCSEEIKERIRFMRLKRSDIQVEEDYQQSFDPSKYM